MTSLEQIIARGWSAHYIGPLRLRPVLENDHQHFILEENAVYRGTSADPLADDDLVDVIMRLGARDDFWPEVDADDRDHLEREFVRGTLADWRALPDPYPAKIRADVQLWQATQAVRRRFWPRPHQEN